MEDRRNKLEGVILLIAFLLFEYTLFFFRLFIVVVVILGVGIAEFLNLRGPR